MKIFYPIDPSDPSLSSESYVSLAQSESPSLSPVESAHSMLYKATLISVELIALISMAILIRRGFRYLSSLGSAPFADEEKSRLQVSLLPVRHSHIKRTPH